MDEFEDITVGELDEVYKLLAESKTKLKKVLQEYNQPALIHSVELNGEVNRLACI